MHGGALMPLPALVSEKKETKRKIIGYSFGAPSHSNDSRYFHHRHRINKLQIIDVTLLEQSYLFNV